jgi:hypothetical protein
MQYKSRIQRKTWCIGPYAGVGYNLTLSPLQSRLQHIYHGQPYARVEFIPSQGLWIWPHAVCTGAFVPCTDGEINPDNNLSLETVRK